MIADPLAPLVKLFECNLEWAKKVALRVHRRLPPSFQLADLEQVAIIKMWDRCQRYDPRNKAGVPFQAYAILAVRGAVLMSVRRRAWREATADSLDERMVCGKLQPDEEAIAAEARTAREAAVQKQKRWLRRQLLKLPVGDRRLFRRHYIDAVAIAALAKEVGMPKKAVGRRLRSVMRLLKRAKEAKDARANPERP